VDTIVCTVLSVEFAAFSAVQEKASSAQSSSAVFMVFSSRKGLSCAMAYAAELMGPEGGQPN
jgi:hypothetical protein